MHDTAKQCLQEHYISITQPTVIAALQSEDAEVRKAASQVLFNSWPKDAASPIEVALLQENDEWTRISMAFDLGRLGGKAGRDVLLSECHDRGQWGSTRMLAARHMIELHDDSCVDSVLEILRSDSDPQDTNAKMDAVDLVPSFIKHFTAQEYQNVLYLAVNALNDPDLGVRLTASNTLGGIGDVSALPALQAAFEAEQSAVVRGAMVLQLKRLHAQRLINLQQGPQ